MLPSYHGRVVEAASNPFYPTWSGWLVELAGRDLDQLRLEQQQSAGR